MPLASVHGKFMKPQDQLVLTASAVEKVIKVLPKLIALSKTYKGGHSVGASKKTKQQAPNIPPLP